MKVGLVQIDGKWPNLALMKLSAYHKKQGDEVTLIDISNHKFDRIYASKIFAGGSGVDLKSELPKEIELLTPDYDLYGSEGKIGFTSRGCIRDCGFCIVREKEGWIKETPFEFAPCDKVLLLDNNFLASPQWKEKLDYFIRHQIKVCFTQGLDIRLVNDENASLLSKVRYYDNHFRKRRLYFSFDNPSLINIVKEGVGKLVENGVLSHHLMFYVLVGYDTTFDQDYFRFTTLRELGVLPFIMLYNNSKNTKLRKFARWVNRRYYKVVEWEKYDG